MLDPSDIRRPEYTGENRCWPCTIVNTVIAAVASVLTFRRSKLLGAVTLLGSAGAIYLRGYLVPGTPTLTKRYLPDEVLREFDKEPARMQVGSESKGVAEPRSTASRSTRTTRGADAGHGSADSAGEDVDAASVDPDDDPANVDIEAILTANGVVTPCRDGTDLCLTSEFEETWTERLDLDATDESTLRGTLGVDAGEYSFDQPGDATTLSRGDEVVSQWSSPAAIAVDVAAASLLAERVPRWERLVPEQRARILTSLRVFLESCPTPDCDGSVTVGEEVVESCCRSFDVVVAACEECDVRLMEMEWNGESLNPDAEAGSATGQT